jgi:hypothetical protein
VLGSMDPVYFLIGFVLSLFTYRLISILFSK